MEDDVFSASDFAPADTGSAGDQSGATDATAAATGAATTQPADASATTANSSTATARPAGPIPFDVHSRALDNARAKAVEEAQQQWRQQYGWAEQVPQQDFQQMSAWYQRANADPIAFAQELIAELNADPTHGAAIRSMAARALQQGRGQSSAGQLPVIELENGQVVDLNQFRAQIAEELRAEYAPALKTAKELAEEKTRIANDAAATQFGSTLFGEVSQLPYFTENKAEVGAHLAQYLARFKGQPGSDDPRFIEAALFRSYNAIVLPKLATAERRAVLHDINNKAAAGSVQPGQTGTRPPKSMDDMTIAEALAHTAATMAG